MEAQAVPPTPTPDIAAGLLPSNTASCFQATPGQPHSTRLLLRLNPELLALISYHLKPRHVYKLMQTSKLVKSRVDTEEYWARAAVHAVFRHFEEVEIMDCDEEHRTFPKLTGLYSLVNLDLGYSETINVIIGRVRQVMARQGSPAGWNELADAPLTALVRAGEADIGLHQSDFMDGHAAYLEEARTMKDVVKREALWAISKETSLDTKLRRFQVEMDEDSSHSLQTKRWFMQTFAKLFDDVGCKEMLETDLYLFGCMAGEF